MRRQNCHSGAQECCSSKYTSNTVPLNRHVSSKETSSEQDGCCRCKTFKRHSFDPPGQNDNDEIDETTLIALSALRQKACKFIESEYTSTSESSFNPCTCQTRMRSKEGSPVQKMQEVIDYTPQSEFLKKMKSQSPESKFQKKQILSMNEDNENEMLPKVWEECIMKSNEIDTLLQEMENRQLSNPYETSYECRMCQCNETSPKRRPSSAVQGSNECRSCQCSEQRRLGSPRQASAEFRPCQCNKQLANSLQRSNPAVSNECRSCQCSDQLMNIRRGSSPRQVSTEFRPCRCSGEQRSSSRRLGNSPGPTGPVCRSCRCNEVQLQEESYLPDSGVKCCQCNIGPEIDSQDMSNINRIVRTCRSVVNGLRSVVESLRPNLIGNTYDDLENEEEIPAAGDKKSKKSKGKYQHVSRTKKRVKCRGRKKRKSKDNEKCDSQDNFEPTLKRPHENSCERCWRYASPSRSPVNKPDQRFNPNFRRAHSCHELTERSEAEIEADLRGCCTCEPFDGATSPNQTVKPVVNYRINELTGAKSECPTPGPNVANTRVKELMLDGRGSRPQSQKSQNQRRGGDGKDRLEESAKRRPKSCSPGTRNYDDVNVTQSSKDGRCRPSPTLTSTPRSPRNNIPSPNFSQNFVSLAPVDNSFSRLDLNHTSGGRLQDTFSGNAPKNSRSGCYQSYGGRRNADTFDWTSTGYREIIPTTNDPSFTREGGFVKCTCKKSQQRTRTGSPNSFKGSRTGDRRLSPGKCGSSEFLQNAGQSSTSQRPRTAGYNSSSNRFQNESSYRWGNESKRYGVRSRQSSRDYEEENGEIDAAQDQRKLCCHCPVDHEQPSQEPSNRYMRNSLTQNLGMNDEQYGQSQSGYRRTYDSRQSFNYLRSERDVTDGHGPRIQCPYRSCANDSDFGRSQENCESQVRRNGLNETYPPASRRGCTKKSYFEGPKQYSVFYMTKNKNNTGNEVEVLVEELTERNKTPKEDPKTVALKKKMMKIQNCPEDSMALKFQKGVSECGKTPQNSRILYF